MIGQIVFKLIEVSGSMLVKSCLWGDYLFYFYYYCIIHHFHTLLMYYIVVLFVSGSGNKRQNSDSNHGITQRGGPAGHTCRIQADVWQISLHRYHCKTWRFYLPCHASFLLVEHRLSVAGCVCFAAFVMRVEAEVPENRQHLLLHRG